MLDESLSGEIILKEPAADEATLQKPPSQGLTCKKPASDIMIEENSSDEGDIPETPPIEKSAKNSSSVATGRDAAVKQAPTWSTFNSLTGDPLPIWNVGIAAPLYRRSPTEWPVLLTILMQAQRINCINCRRWI